jgi:penicillin-binding protein 1A
VLGGLCAFGFAAMILYYGADLPETSELRDYQPPQTTRITARDGTVLSESHIERRTVVPLDQISDEMKNAIVAAEDANFYQHEGLDYFGILRALLRNVKAGGIRQGASTITQQVVKNILLSHERSFERKLRELILARRIEQELSKDEILELYLNHIYFGHGRYGVEEASRYYFGKSASELRLAEAALLAGIVKGPSIYSPRKNPEGARARRHYVLGQLAQKGFATEADAAAADEEPIVLAEPPAAPEGASPEIVDAVEEGLAERLGAGAREAGYTVQTSIDPALQAAALEAVRTNLDRYAARHGLLVPFARRASDPAPFEGTPQAGGRIYAGVVTAVDDAQERISLRVGTVDATLPMSALERFNPRGMKASEAVELGAVLRVQFLGDPAAGKLHLAHGPESALVAIEVESGEVLAMVGGYGGKDGGFNRATMARRQPGSSFKTIVYAYGIHSGELTESTSLPTDPDAIPGEYRPRNYDGKGGAPVSLRKAMARSVNVSAVWALQELGPGRVIEFARELGIGSRMEPDLSLALGAYEMSPLEMAGAYTVFAAGGIYRKPTAIRQIEGPQAEAEPPPEAEPRRVMSDRAAYAVTRLLRGVVTDGTATAAQAIQHEVAGKTGTSNDGRDAWFVGYSPSIVCAVWVGFDDNRPLGDGEGGGATALPVFIAFMQAAHAGEPQQRFSVPEGLEPQRESRRGRTGRRR